MRRDSIQNGLPVPDEGAARKLCLGPNTPAPDLADIKDFMRFHLSLSRGKIVEKSTAESANTFAEWFFAGFTRVTGTPIEDEDRHEVYEVGIYTRGAFRVNADKPSGLGRPWWRRASL